MDIDPDISNWILDFLLRQPLEDRTLNTLLRTLPLPDDKPNLKILLLLRKLDSDVSRNSISECALEVLERLEEISFQRGVEAVSDEMKQAYCSVAVECTVRYLVNGHCGEIDGKFKFFEAVKRLWRGRVGRMERLSGKGGLGSEELWDWKDEMEAAVWEDSACENVLKRSKTVNATEALRIYIKQERERMGPSFIELVAQILKDDEVLKEVLVIGRSDSIAGEHESTHYAGRNSDPGVHNNEVQKGKFRPQHMLVGSNRSRGVKIADSGSTKTGQSYRNYKLPSSAEVNRVQEALESSSLELQAVVKDPLPDALRLAESISDMAGQSKSHDPMETEHVEANLFVADGAGVVQGNGCTADNVHRPSLMERNSSARTYEWEDSIHNSQGGSEEDGVRHKLPSPKKIHVSPLNKYEVKIFKKRRKIRKWSPLEEDTLRTGVEKYGKGHWKVILTAYHDIFEDRTEVDLKDKWRNLTRY
ncbi:hypothetical protein F511_39401 [Dorcoceras hygrometricum]|uniref:Uncharacterized protein n=1 Tax=Dorcoceras hygrometricum TaxID=472368 RepID=A0A2Z7C2Q7_9LAMI|nr:hypothetical protein F511_39401 [Dorcoceras hygrometricum]